MGRAGGNEKNPIAYTAVSNLDSSLTKKLYFFPGVYDDPPRENKII